MQAPHQASPDGDPPQIRLADPSHGGNIPLAQLRTHARTHARNASAIEIDFPVRGAFSRRTHTPNLRLRMAEAILSAYQSSVLVFEGSKSGLEEAPGPARIDCVVWFVRSLYDKRDSALLLLTTLLGVRSRREASREGPRDNFRSGDLSRLCRDSPR